MNNMDLYEQARRVPEEAKKTIGAGRLKGFTDINPMWRIKKLTEMFGPCGIGWWYVITDKRIEAGSNGVVCAFVDIELYYKIGDSVSYPIPGTGGSNFISKENAGLYTSDECFKMALTDALSVAAKSIGMGADVYYQKDRDKYTALESVGDRNTAPSSGLRPLSDLNRDVKFRCADCGEELRPYTGTDGRTVSLRKHAEGSEKKYGKVLCINCIKKMQSAGAEE